MLGGGYQAAIDIGSNRVVCALAARRRDGSLYFEAIGEADCQNGIRQGVVVDIDIATAAVKKAVEEASEMASRRVHGAVVCLSGDHIESETSRGMARISGAEVSESEITQVMEAAQAVPQVEQRILMHSLPREFLVDGRGGVRRPLGMAGVRLEVDALVISADANVCRNLSKVMAGARVRESFLLSSALAASAAALDPDEMQLGVCVLDIGAGTTDIGVFKEGRLQLIQVLPLGGDVVTADIARMLRMPTAAAEEMKRRYGSVCPELIAPEEEIDLPQGNRSAIKHLTRQRFAEVAAARYREIFQRVAEILEQHEISLSEMSSVVLTGGGSRIESIGTLAEAVLHSASRVSRPRVAGSLQGVLEDPSYAAVVGAMRFATEVPAPFDCRFMGSQIQVKGQTTSKTNWLRQLTGWLKENY